MVPQACAQSSAVGTASWPEACGAPQSTAVSPTRAGAGRGAPVSSTAGPRSMTTWSMHTRPTMEVMRLPTPTGPAELAARGMPSE